MPVKSKNSDLALAIADSILPVNLLTQSQMDEFTPFFVHELDKNYRAKIAHAFIIHGNVGDYMDNSGAATDIWHTLCNAYDTFRKASMVNVEERPRVLQGRKNVVSYFTVGRGFEFATPQGAEAWEEIFKQGYNEFLPKPGQSIPANPVMGVWQAYLNNKLGVQPMNLGSITTLMNLWFRLASSLAAQNLINSKDGKTMVPEITMNFIFFDAHILFPKEGNVEDRIRLALIREWARDTGIGDRNKLVFLTSHVSDMNADLRGPDSRIVSILVKRPDITQRSLWIQNYDNRIQKRSTTSFVQKLDGRALTCIRYSEDMTADIFAIQSAGLNRRQLEQVHMNCEVANRPIDLATVRSVKQRVIQEEFSGLVDFLEPTHGFEQIGGQELLKSYFQKKVVDKLKSGNTRTCSRGVLIPGPPGTGKTKLALAVAKESGLNFIKANFGNLFGGIVGATESRTEKFFEAVENAAPVIVFADELDTALTSGSGAQGDSGTSTRMLSRVMQWLSDDSRTGKVVFIGATNRPDNLLPALIRAGRFDAIIPQLPPNVGNVEGRLQILNALRKGLSVRFHEDLKQTLGQKDNGLGRLLLDNRIWTGAEMELVIKDAVDNAEDSGNTDISLDDWNLAMDSIIPNTGQMQIQIDLALTYCNNAKYIPDEWKEARNKLMESSTGLAVHNSNGYAGLGSERD